MRNSVHLIGHLGKDPVVKTYSADRKRATFTIATTDSYKNQKGEKIEETQWHDVVIWGPLAEVAATYLKKGHEVAIEGKLVHRVYETRDGYKRYVTEVSVNDMLMLGGKDPGAERLEEEEAYMPVEGSGVEA